MMYLRHMLCVSLASFVFHAGGAQEKSLSRKSGDSEELRSRATETSSSAVKSNASRLTGDLAFLGMLPRVRVQGEARISSLTGEQPPGAGDGDQGTKVAELRVESYLMEPAIAFKLISDVGEHVVSSDDQAGKVDYWHAGQNMAFERYPEKMLSLDAATLGIYEYLLTHRENAVEPGTDVTAEPMEGTERKVTLLLSRSERKDGGYSRSKAVLHIDGVQIRHVTGYSCMYDDGDHLVREYKMFDAEYDDFDSAFPQLPRRITATSFIPAGDETHPNKRFDIKVSQIERLPEERDLASVIPVLTTGLAPYVSSAKIAAASASGRRSRPLMILGFGAMLVFAVAGIRSFTTSQGSN